MYRPSLRSAVVALLVVAAPELGAQAVPPSRFESRDTVPPLPKGLGRREVMSGMGYGAIGGAVGIVAGLGIMAYSASSAGPDDGWGLILVPAAGGVVGYVAGAVYGVRKAAAAQGVKANPAAAIAGGLVGTLGALAGGVPFFVTVPLGAALAHNAARRQ